MGPEWFVSKDGKKLGPYTVAQLKAFAASGQLQPSDSVWKQGTTQPVPASAIKGLFGSTGFSQLSRTTPPASQKTAGAGVLGYGTVGLAVLLSIAAAGLALAGSGGDLPLGPIVAGAAILVGLVAAAMGLARGSSLVGPAVSAVLLGLTALVLSLGLMRPTDQKAADPALAQLDQERAALAQERARTAEALDKLAKQREQFEQEKEKLERRAREAEAKASEPRDTPPAVAKAKEPEEKAPPPVEPLKPLPEPEKKPPEPITKKDMAPDNQVQAKVKAYVNAAEAERPALLQALRAHDNLQQAEVKTWFDFTMAEINQKPGCDPATPKTLHHPRFPIKYKLVGQPKAGEPLVIFLHGGGPNSKMNDSAWQGGGGTGLGFPCVAVPRVFDDTQAVGWWEDSALISITAMLDEIKRTHKIDTNRVYLGGYSMGGFGTPMVGTLLADRWAGIFSLAGGCTALEPYPNLRNTPFAIHIGDADKANGRLATTRKMRDIVARLQEADKEGYPLSYKEYPGVGHGLPAAAEMETGQWLKQFKRDPYPKTLTWKPMKDSLTMFHWLKVTPASLPPTAMRVTIQSNQLVNAPIIRARIEDNRISIEAPGVRGLSVFLNDSMVDLSKPVTVLLDGKEVFNAKVGYMLTALVESLTAKEDANMYFTARVDIRR